MNGQAVQPTTTNDAPAIIEQKVQRFAGQVISDMAAGMAGVMVQLGHELGLYKAMMGAGPLTAAELAEKTGTFRRYVQEWLNNQAAGGYITYDPHTQRYELPLEHGVVLAIDDSPAFMPPGFNVVRGMWMDKDMIREAFRTGRGIGWHEHHHDLFHGTEAFYKTGYRTSLVNDWIPALDGIREALERGGRVADIGCGHGASTIIMAKAYPNSRFFGFDYHTESIEVARRRAEAEGVTNVRFEAATAETFTGDNYDLICYMDSFHDMGNPLAAVAYARRRLASNGSIMLVEPAASDYPEENFHPLGRLFYAASTAFCVPNSHSQPGGYCLGAQAGPAKTERIVHAAGYSTFRIARQTPVNLIYEAKA